MSRVKDVFSRLKDEIHYLYVKETTSQSTAFTPTLNFSQLMKQLIALHPKYNWGETASDNKIKYSKQGNNLKTVTDVLIMYNFINPLNPELNPICYLLALLGAHHFLHVSRIRVKSLTFRRLVSYIYGTPILDVSRSHTTTQHSR